MIAYDSSSSGDTGGVGVLNIPHTCSALTGRAMVVVTTVNVSGISYAGATLTQWTSYTPVSPPGTNNPPIFVWKLANPASGLNTLAVTTTGPASVAAVSYTGTNPGWNPLFNFFNTDTNNVQVVTTTVGLTTLINNSWVIGFVTHTGLSKTLSAGAGTTLRIADQGNINAYGVGIFDNNGAVSPPALTSETFDINSSEYLTMSLWELPETDTTFSGQMLII